MTRPPLARFLLIGAVVFVLGATLFPAGPAMPIEWREVFCVLCGPAPLADALANIALFVPLGIALALLNHAPRSALLLAAGLSLVVELAQFWIPGRDPSLGDVLCNTLGAGLGGGLIRLVPRWAWPGARTSARLSLLAALAASTAVALTAVLLTVALPDTAYFGGSASIQPTDRPLRIGGSTEPGGYFQGRIDDVRVYRRARTPDEIQGDMLSPVTATARSTDLVTAYNFDEGSGTEVADISGHGHTGRIRGATWTDQGRFGSALAFDGVGSVVLIAPSPELDLAEAMTLEAWIYPTASQRGWRAVLQKEFDAYFLLSGSRAGALKPTGGATFGLSTEMIAAPAVIPTGAWTHMALTYDGAMLQLYIDGRLAMCRQRWYPGRVIATTVDGLDVPGGLIGEWGLLRRRLLSGAALRVRAVAAAAKPVEAPLAVLQDAARNEVLRLAVEGDDVVFRLRSLATAAGLDSPPLRARGLLRGLRPGETFTVVASRSGQKYCVGVDARVICDLGFTAGMGWGFFGYSQFRAGWVHQALNALWAAALLTPFGLWCRCRWESLVGITALVSTVVLACLFGPLTITPVEISAALAGVVAGRALGSRRARFAGDAQNRWGSASRPR